jgi:hypothetical protein
MEKTDMNPELQKHISRWQTAYFLSEAILEDYAERMAKLQEVSPQSIKDDVRKLAQAKFAKSKEKP